MVLVDGKGGRALRSFIGVIPDVAFIRVNYLGSDLFAVSPFVPVFTKTSVTCTSGFTRAESKQFGIRLARLKRHHIADKPVQCVTSGETVTRVRPSGQNPVYSPRSFGLSDDPPASPSDI